MLNLVLDSWIPVRERGRPSSERPRLAAPHELAAEDVTGLCWSRADFNLSCRELMTGMLQLAMPPRDDEEWFHHWQQPDPEKWRRALEPWAPYFFLGGRGPRFAQDIEPFEDTIRPDRIRPAASLLYDSPGMRTAAQNADLFFRRHDRLDLGPAEVAMALCTLQSWATVGGAGYRVSMRGGGPLVTLVVPESENDTRCRLAREIWANVMPGPSLAPRDAALALPWLRPTITSQDGSSVGPGDTHSLEAYFGQPRRARLIEPGTVGDPVLACQVPHGTRYRGWRHPFSPQYRGRTGSDWLPARALATDPDQRHWPTWSLSEMQTSRHRPAPVVDAFRRRAACRFCILAGGWSVRKSKALNFTIGRFPAIGQLRSSAEDRIAGLSECASAFASTLRRACDPGGCASDVLPDEFLRATAPAFGAAVGAIEAGRDLDAEAAWVDASLQAALALAGEVASPLSGRADPQWISRAFASIGRRKLGLQSPDNEDRQ